MPGHDVVVHFAAESHVDRSIAGPAVFLETNVVGTGVLIDAAYRHGIGRFIHSRPTRCTDRSSKVRSRERPARPSSPYSSSKAGSDLLALSYGVTYGYDVVVTRCTNNYGPYQFPEKVIPLFVTNLLEDKKVPLYGDGRNERDWLYVEDHCSAIHLLVDQGSSGEVYNIGADAQLSNLELTHRSSTPSGSTTRGSTTFRTASATTFATPSTRRSSDRSAGSRSTTSRIGSRHDRLVPLREDWWRPLKEQR